MYKRFVGKFVTVNFSDRKSSISGFVIDSAKDWTLLKFNFTDYLMDGYIIFKHKNVKEVCRGARERFKEKVIRLKGEHLPKFSELPLDSLESIMTALTKRYGVFQFDLKSEKACYLGKLDTLNSSKLTIDYLNPKGIWSKQMYFRPNDIRTIEFDTDYINSLKLISKRPRK